MEVSSGNNGSLSPTRRAASRLQPWFLFVAQSRFVDSIREAARNSELTSQGEALADNIAAVIATTMFPAMSAMNEIKSARFQRLMIAEHISAGAHSKELTDEEHEICRKNASLQCEEEFSSDDGLERLFDDTVDRLNASLRSTEIKATVEELLRQATVSIWSSFEVFSGDIAIELVNIAPHRALSLFQSEKTRRHLGGKGSISLEVLAACDFDLSGKVGNLIWESRRLDALNVIRDIFSVLAAENSTLQKKLSCDDMWILNQRRHLIVHRRGIVDQEYLNQTSEKLQLGSRLCPRSEEVETYLGTIRDVATGLLLTFPAK